MGGLFFNFKFQMTNSKKELIRNHLRWTDITTHYNIKWDGDDKKNISCPFHEDKKPSCSLDNEKKVFNCFSCEQSGDYYAFIAEKEGLDCKSEFQEVLEIAEKIAGTNYLEPKEKASPGKRGSSNQKTVLSPEKVQKYSKQLQSSAQVKKWFFDKGISSETLEKANIGYGACAQYGGKSVIHFPYQDRKGNFITNRVRCLKKGSVVMSLEGSKNELFLLSNLNKTDRVFITEGETDTLTVFQHTNEVVGVTSATGFKEGFLREFKHLKEVILCGDNDDSGKDFNKSTIALFQKKYPHIKTYYLDWKGAPEKFDVNDFYLSLSEKEKCNLVEHLESKKVEVKREIITPLQFFSSNFACTTIWEDRVSQKGALSKNPFLITSNREKLPLKPEKLLDHFLVLERMPVHKRDWSIDGVERFLSGMELPTFRDLFEVISAELEIYIFFEDRRFYKLIPLWIMGTYFHRGMMSYPYLSFQGNKACGKTKLLYFIAILSFQGLLNTGSTAASITRLVSSNHTTCCVDEAENLRNTKDENVTAVLAIYNSGYKAGVTITKCGVNNVVEEFDPYSPKAFGGINQLSDTLTSRCIQLIMPPVKNRSKFNEELSATNNKLKTIKDELYSLMLGRSQELFSVYESIVSPSDKIIGRDWEIWKPIFSLAEIVGEDVMNDIKELAVELTQKRNASDFSSEDDIEFLKIVLEVLRDEKGGEHHCSIQYLAEKLRDSNSERFQEEFERCNSSRWIGDWLKRLHLLEGRNIQKKIGGINERCYKLNESKIIHRLESLGYSDTDSQER